MAADVLSVTVSRRDLADAIDTVFPAVAQRATIEALQHILFSVQPGMVRLSATDLTLSLQAAVLAPDAAGEAAVAVPGRLIRDLVRLLPDGDLSLEVAHGVAMSVRWGGGRQRIAGMDPASFPDFPRHAGTTVEVPAEALATALRRSLVSVAGESDSRRYLQGVCMRTDGQDLLILGSDSVRISLCRVSLTAFGGPVDFILPAHAARALADMLDGSDGVQILAFGPSGMTVELPGSKVMSTARIDGEYPDLPRLLESLLPNGEGGALTVDAAAFGQAVRRAKLLVSEGAGIEIAAENGTVRIRGAWKAGDADDAVPADVDGAVAGKAVSVNPDYVLDVLRVLGFDRLSVRLTGPVKPIVIRPDGDSSFDYVVLPLISN